MSISHTYKCGFAKVFSVLALALPLVLSGCGSSDDATTAQPTATADATLPTSQQGRAESTATSPTAGPTDGAANPNDAGAGDEEAARVGVEIGLANGGFTKATPRTVHVPSFFAIELDVTVADAGPYTLTIDDGATQKTETYDKAGRYKLLLNGLRPNRSITVKLAEDKVKITADAEPGP